MAPTMTSSFWLDIRKSKDPLTCFDSLSLFIMVSLLSLQTVYCCFFFLIKYCIFLKAFFLHSDTFPLFPFNTFCYFLSTLTVFFSSFPLFSPSQRFVSFSAYFHFSFPFRDSSKESLQILFLSVSVN